MMPFSLKNALPLISGYVFIALAALFTAIFFRSMYYKEAMLVAVLVLFMIRIYHHQGNISRKIISNEVIYACGAYFAILILKTSTIYFFTAFDPIGKIFDWFLRI